MNFPNIIFSEQIDHALGWTVLHSIWQITLIALLAGFLLFLLRNHPSARRYLVLNGALLAIVLCTAGTFYTQLNSEKFNFQTAKSTWENIQQSDTTSVKTAAMAQQGIPPLQAPRFKSRPVTKSWEDYFFEHQPLVVLLWLLGLVVGIFRLMGGISYVHVLRSRMHFQVDPYWIESLERLCQKARYTTQIDLLESALVRSPITVGFLKPAILFPIGVINRLSEQEVEAILAHELAHITRHDYLFNLLQSFIETLFYYHPAIWWLSAQVRNERENACDDLAIGWLGNRLDYAKALVVMQEIAFLPQSPSLVAFAGTSRGQFLNRVQRLFSPQKFKVHIMEKWIATLLVACSIVVLAVAQRNQVNNPNSNQNTETTSIKGPNNGIWQADFFKDSVCLNMSSGSRGNRWMSGQCYLQSEFPGFKPTAGDVRVELKRAAGTLTLTGKIEGTEGFGKYQFLPSESYLATLEKEGIQVKEEHLMFQLFWADFQQDYVASMRKAGFKTIDEDMLLQLAIFNISVTEAKNLSELSKKFGKEEISVEHLVQFKIANITPENINELVKSGMEGLDMDAMVNLTMQQVEPEYVEKMNGLGFGKLSAEEILSAKIQGITPEYVAEIRALKLENPSFDDIISMKAQGITAEEVQKMQNLGLGKLSLEEVVAMRVHDIDVTFIQKASSYGLGKLDLEDLMALKIHGIDAAFIQEAQGMGLGKLDLEGLMGLKIHQITPAFAQQFRELGFKNLTLEDLMSARIHDVTPKFIEEAGQKGYKFPKLEEYAEYKIRSNMFKQGE